MSTSVLDEPIAVEVRKRMESYDDVSHDFGHVKRVYHTAMRIYSSEQDGRGGSSLDRRVVELAALVHDFADHKYMTPGAINPASDLDALLTSHGIMPEIRARVLDIVSCVSFSHETINPSFVRAVLAKHPELAVVQDADRLDALGAIGIARMFSYGAARGRGRELGDTTEHIEEKLVKLQSMMKTEMGQRLAEARTQRVLEFRKWWDDETSWESCEQ